VLGRECFVMPPNRTQRRLRAASDRTYSAAAKAASQPLRRRNGSACRSGSNRPQRLHGQSDRTAHRHPTACWRTRLRPLTAARSRRDARGRRTPRAGTPAQTAPDRTPICNATGTSPSLSRFTHLSPGRTVCLPVENLLQCNIATIWAEFAIHLTCCQKTPHCYLGRGLVGIYRKSTEQRAADVRSTIISRCIRALTARNPGSRGSR
jgi:hypothetical protein